MLALTWACNCISRAVNLLWCNFNLCMCIFSTVQDWVLRGAVKILQFIRYLYVGTLPFQ